MDRTQEVIELLHDMRKTHRMQPLGFGRMIEESFKKVFGLLESVPEPTHETQRIHRQYNKALEETKLIIDDDIKQVRINVISLEYRELLSLCDIIDRLTAENAKLRLDIKTISECAGKELCVNCKKRVSEALKGE